MLIKSNTIGWTFQFKMPSAMKRMTSRSSLRSLSMKSVAKECMVNNVAMKDCYPETTLIDEGMPFANGLKSLSSENVSQHKINNSSRHRSSLSGRVSLSGKKSERDVGHNPICNLPLPISMTLGISALSDSKLYSYHASQDFLTFLTESARDMEEAERSQTINAALAQSRELKRLVDENTRMVVFVRNTQEYNPSTEIDNEVVENIRTSLEKHRTVVTSLCERAKSYKDQLLLAESDLDNHCSQDTKSDLLAMHKTLSWMSMIVRYHTWGRSSAEVEGIAYHSDEDLYSHHRKLGRRNGIRVRSRPQWCETTQAGGKSALPEIKRDTKSIVKSSLKVATFSFGRT